MLLMVRAFLRMSRCETTGVWGRVSTGGDRRELKREMVLRLLLM